MSRDMESVISSAVSLSVVESLSDDGSAVDIGGDRARMAGGIACALFDLGDGDLHLTMNGTTLETHKFLIKRFDGLKGRIMNDTITLESGEPGLEVFQDALNILYASVIEGPFDFDHTTLTSALLLATRYDFPALRAFAIDKLEKAGLSAVERIRLAREFDIPSWEEPAFLELCERDEPLSMPEAEVLGLNAVLHVAIVRERELRRKLKETGDIKGTVKGEAASRPSAVEGPAMTVTIEGRSIQTTSPPGSVEGPALEPVVPVPTTELELANTLTEAKPLSKPDFTNTLELPARELYAYCSNRKIEVPLLDCDCKVDHATWTSPTACKCKLPPCAISAFKHLQTQQSAHKINISTLKSTIEQMRIAIISLKPVAEDAAKTAPPSPSKSSSLQDDVKKWLIS